MFGWITVWKRVTSVEPDRCNILLIPAEKLSRRLFLAVRSKRSVSYRCEQHLRAGWEFNVKLKDASGWMHADMWKAASSS